MPIDPNRPPMSDRVQSLQRETYSDLPDANKTTAFTLAWVEFDEPGHPKGMYVNRVTTPQGDHQWEMVGGGAVGSSLPDMRFVVGKKLLSLESPGSSTYVTISDAVAAASAYQAISGGLPAVILVHPDKYDESVTLPPGVSMSGLSSGSNKVVIGGSVTNGRSLSHPQSGPIAVVPFPGESIGDLTGTDPNITSMDYLILAGGDFVDLSSTSTGWKICG